MGCLSWDSTRCVLPKVALEGRSSVAGRGFAQVRPPPVPLALHLDLTRFNPRRNPRGHEGLIRQDLSSRIRQRGRSSVDKTEVQ